MKSCFFFSLILVSVILPIQAMELNPDPRCGQEEETRKLYESNPESELEAKRFAEKTRNFNINTRRADSYIIPTVFHVFGTDFAGEKVDDALIIDALNKTNNDFQGLTEDWNDVSPDFAPVKKALDITFKLARKDPDGNPTTGIVYHPENSGFGNGSGFDSEIQKYAWDNYKYMNVYIMLDLYADSDYYNSGVSWYPDTWMSDNNLARTVYNGRYLGTNTDENFRRILTHEFGHWLNLKHTFQDGCTMPNDECEDTPPTTSNSGSCNLTEEKCSGYGIPNGENFMDYTECYRMFTIDQVTRMVAALETHPAREPLWQPLNLKLTGVSDDPLEGVIANFSAEPVKVSVGGKVVFTNGTQIENGTTISSAEWKFDGGTPAVYSGENPPEITYNTEGTYDVELTVANSKGDSDTEKKNGIITVKNEYPKPYFRFGSYSHIGNVKFGSIDNTTEETGINDYLNTHVTDVAKGENKTLSVTAKVGNSGSSDQIRVRAWIDWNNNWLFDSNELVMGKEFSASEGDKTFTQEITVPDDAAVSKTGLRVIVCYKQGSEGDNSDDVMDSGESEDYGVNITGAVSLSPVVKMNAFKNLSVQYKRGTLTFSAPLPEKVRFSLIDAAGRTLYKDELSQGIIKVPLKLGGKVLYWRAENIKNQAQVFKGTVLIKK